MFKTALMSIFVSAAIAISATADVTKESFQLQSGADLAALCGVKPSDPLYSAALHMCHGFGVGTYRTVVEVQKSLPDQDPMICEPTGEPLTRNQYFERFANWAKGHTEQQSEAALDFFARFLESEFPCAK